MKHLWEYDHPYYCTEGNYLYAPVHHSDLTVHDVLPSWEAFKNWEDGFYSADRDMNLLFRWDWKAWHLEFPEDEPDDDSSAERHQLCLYFMLQRKAFCRSLYVNVTEADEPEIRAWLEECAQTVRALWEPMIATEAVQS